MITFQHCYSYLTVLPNLLSELIVRFLILVCVIAIHWTFQRPAHCITLEELIEDYKKPRRDSIVAPWVMMSVIICIPCVVISLPAVLFRNYIESIHAFLAWSLALLINALLTEALKVVVGRPRPDFFYRCYPDGVFTPEMPCTGVTKAVVDGRKSFPSGHSSFSFCSLGFLSVWLYGKFSERNGRNVHVVIFCIMPIFLACFIGYSRCCDNHHHWQDVVAGAVIGLVTAYQCYKCHRVTENHISM